MKQVFIIAEAGVNHNGNIKVAKRLVELAADAGADAVKFQTFSAERLVSRSTAKAQYQKRNTGNNDSQLLMLKKYELGLSAHRILISHCRMCGIQFLSTPFDFPSIDLLARLKLKIFKISSGEITNLPYLRRIGSLKQSIILSTGMASLGEVEAAIEALCSAGAMRTQITLLHCTTEYPAPLKEVNLNAMLTMRDAFKMRVGYSDHTLGISVSLAAVGMGAEIIEKHLTLNKNMAGPDHKASLDPKEFKDLVQGIRIIETALGDGVKRPGDSENRNKKITRKSIIALKNIKKGEKYSEHNLTVKRPGSGISPMEWDRIIGRYAIRDYKSDDLISW
jgi:N,N'-diacetyllegionaminate synthase